MLIKEKLLNQFGEIDIYLFDQFLKGRFDKCERVLDAGCGKGRNLTFLLKQGMDVYGVDRDVTAIQLTRKQALELAPHLPSTHFQLASLESLPFSDGFFDVIVCSAVLHFSESEDQFFSILKELWRVLKREGFLFVRLASSIGIEDLIQSIPPLENRRFTLPDGTDRFLVDEALLLNATKMLNAQLLDPIKTTNVQNLRCMTTWCLAKNGG